MGYFFSVKKLPKFMTKCLNSKLDELNLLWSKKKIKCHKNVFGDKMMAFFFLAFSFVYVSFADLFKGLGFLHSSPV